MGRDDAAPSLLPVLHWPAVRDAEVLSLVVQGWPRLTQPQRLRSDRGVLFGRPALVDVADPSEPVMKCSAAR